MGISHHEAMLTTPVFGSEVPVQVCAHTLVVLVDRTVLSPHSVLKEPDGGQVIKLDLPVSAAVLSRSPISIQVLVTLIIQIISLSQIKMILSHGFFTCTGMKTH